LSQEWYNPPVRASGHEGDGDARLPGIQVTALSLYAYPNRR